MVGGLITVLVGWGLLNLKDQLMQEFKSILVLPEPPPPVTVRELSDEQFEAMKDALRKSVAELIEDGIRRVHMSAAEERNLIRQIHDVAQNYVSVKLYVSDREDERGKLIVNQRNPLVYELLRHSCEYEVRHIKGTKSVTLELLLDEHLTIVDAPVGSEAVGRIHRAQFNVLFRSGQPTGTAAIEFGSGVCPEDE